MDAFIGKLINGQLTQQELKLFDEFVQKHYAKASRPDDDDELCLLTDEGRLLIDRKNIDYIAETKGSLANKSTIILRTKSGTRFTLAENIFDLTETV